MPLFEHGFTLRESAEKNTSQKARDAYNDALRSSGFKRFAADRQGVQRWLPHSSRVGEFVNASKAREAIEEAEKAARTADPNHFFVEASTLTAYAPLLTKGEILTPQEILDQAKLDITLARK